MTGRLAPKPDNFDQLSATWNDPESFARERAKYYAQLARERALGIPAHWGEAAPQHPVDVTEPRRRQEDE